MEHRNWNKNNIRTSLLGYGCMRFPIKADGTIDEERAEALLNTAKAGTFFNLVQNCLFNPCGKLPAKE